jgi:hypothetical protein
VDETRAEEMGLVEETIGLDEAGGTTQILCWQYAFFPG